GGGSRPGRPPTRGRSHGMRQSNWFALALAGAALLGATRPSGASTLQLTGDVEIDFPSDRDGVVTIVNNPDANGVASPRNVGQDSRLPDITGWNIKDLRLAYDEQADRMFIGVNFFGVAGDADGDGNPGASSLPNIVNDLPSLGGLESISVS